MEQTLPNQRPSFAFRFLTLPFQGLWFLVRHPIVAIIMALLIVFSSISFLAHFNPAIAERFNSAASLFIGATLLSEASDLLRSVNTQLDNSKRSKLELEADIKKKNTRLEKQRSIIKRKNLALREAKIALDKNAVVISDMDVDLKEKKSILAENERRLAKFRASGDALERRAIKRFTKVAIADAAGEVIGWIPVVGDAASIGMTAGGIYEMCQMFKEIENATTELGVPYRVYTDTFCEKPIEKTAEVVSDTTTHAMDKMNSMVQKIVYKIF